MARASLGSLARAVSACTACGLADTRTRAVPGAGGARARIMLIGEAPGRREDERGEPFVGAAGRVLDAALARAGASRSDVYITNVVKCRPPLNRVPAGAERDACRRHLDAEIALLRPRIICVMGNTAYSSLLGGGRVTQDRGRTIQRGGQKYLVTVHPAAAIYDRSLGGALARDLRRALALARAPASPAAPAAMAPLPRSFYERSTRLVARDLLGRLLVRRVRGGRAVMSGVITETEAYGAGDDPASHAYRGRTERNRAMFGERGSAYVYFTYGMHHCFNAVAYGARARAGAVLIRAVEPAAGRCLMAGNRGGARAISDGPAKLTQAMRITRSLYGADLTRRGELYIAAGSPARRRAVTRGARIGVRNGADIAWNFRLARPRAKR